MYVSKRYDKHNRSVSKVVKISLAVNEIYFQKDTLY